MRDENNLDAWTATDWADFHVDGFVRTLADDDAEALNLDDSIPVNLRDEARRLIREHWNPENDPIHGGDYDESAARRAFIERIAGAHVEEPLRREARALLLGYGPWHLVSQVTGLHMGPFSTELDCHMARSIATLDWKTARAMDRAEFDRHLGA